MTIQVFRAQVAPAEGRSMSARAVPFGVAIEHGGDMVQFDAGSITVPDTVIPLTVDHGHGSLERVGKLERWFEDGDAGYAEFSVSETSLGSDVLTLLHDGVLTDVSVGVAIDEAAEFTDDDGVLHRAGTLDHVSIVGSGAFGKAGSQVLAVHSEKEPIVAEMEAEATAPAVATYDDSELVKKVVELSDKIETISEARVVHEPDTFSDMKDFVLTQRDAGKGDPDALAKMEKNSRQVDAEFAMSADTTTTSAGLVPNYLSKRIIGLLEGNRPTVSAFGTIPAGDYGMSVVLPKVNTQPAVAAQSSEFDQPNSTQAAIATSTYALETYAGANRVSMQLIERSDPSFVDRLFAELASSYATVTDAAFNAALIAGVGTNTAIVADLSTSASATYAAIVAGVGAIAGDIKRPADRLILGSTRWTQLMSLLDADDRPLITSYGPENAPGMPTGSNAWTFSYFPGLVGIHDPHAAATTCLIAWSGAAASIEVSEPRLSVTNVDTLSMDFGIWGLFTDAILYGGNTGGLYSITAS